MDMDGNNAAMDMNNMDANNAKLTDMNMDTSNASGGPQLKLNENGELVLDENSMIDLGGMAGAGGSTGLLTSFFVVL